MKTQQELDRYMEEKIAYYTTPEALNQFESNVKGFEEIYQKNKAFTLAEAAAICLNMEWLCFTIHIPQGSKLFLKLLKLLSFKNANVAQRYWDVYDNKENLKERYNI